MRFLRITKGDHAFTFLLNSRNTRSGFAHDCELLIDSAHVQKAHCYYCNRTWESWSYQSVCLEAIDAELAERKAEIKSDYMRLNGFKRMTAARAKELEAILKCDEWIKLVESVRDDLKSNLHYPA